MHTSEGSGGAASGTAGVGSIETRLEVVTIPVTDVDRAKKFYESLGWRLDETPPGVVQFTPPGSACSVQFGVNRTAAEPGSAQSMFLIVSDLRAARDELIAAGVEVSEIFHQSENGPVAGPDPEHRSYFSLASFSDPDGNGWLFQEITTRLPGRVALGLTAFGSTDELADALRRAEAAHGEHEQRTGERDANWPAWYADYIAREQAGTELPT